MLAVDLLGADLAGGLGPGSGARPDLAGARWAASGAMWLTGRADGPPLPAPRSLATRLPVVGSWLGLPGLDVMALLGERAAITGMYRNGRASVGGRSRLMPTADGRWIAVSLARPEDHESIPAWLGIEVGSDLWADVERAVGERPATDVVEQGVLLGLPIGRLGERATTTPVVGAQRLGTGDRAGHVSGQPLVVDLSSLWAGPLCAHLLGLAGARIVKVESTRRPDGARLGPTAFYDLLHSGHRSVALDLRSPDGVARLRGLLEAADVVLESSRPRALEQLGVDAAGLVAGGGPSVWASITAYGRGGDTRDRVGFGDDAAVAGGLVAWEHDEPRFCGDAIADPLTGIVAAVAVGAAWRSGGGWLLDVPLAGVAAWMAGHGEPELAAERSPADEVAHPRARAAPAPAARIGDHTAEVLTELGLEPGPVHPAR